MKGESMLEVKTREPDMYDNITEAIAQFAGIVSCVVTRYATSQVVPKNDTLMRRVLRESGSITLAGLAMNTTTMAVKVIAQRVKPYIVRN